MPRNAKKASVVEEDRVTEDDVRAYQDEQKNRRIEFVKAAEIAFGRRWQTPMAEILKQLLKREVSVPQVSHWNTGERPVPVEVNNRMRGVVLWLARDLRQRAESLEAMYLPNYSMEELEDLANKKHLLAELQAYIKERE